MQNPKVEIILPDQATGEGIQKTLAYDTPMSTEELARWRDEFWETRTTGQRQVWELLRTACGENEMTAMALVEAAELRLPQNSLTCAIDRTG